MFGGRRSTFVSTPVKFICFSSSRKKACNSESHPMLLFIYFAQFDWYIFVLSLYKIDHSSSKMPLVKELPEFPCVLLLCFFCMGRNLTLGAGTLNSEVLHQKSLWLINPELDNYSDCFAACNSASWVTSKGSQAKMEIGQLVWLPLVTEKAFTWLSGQRSHLEKQKCHPKISPVQTYTNAT